MCFTFAALLTVLVDTAIFYSLFMSVYYLGLLFYVCKVLPFFGYKAVYPSKYSTTFKVIKTQGINNASIKETSRVA